jgi:hypothetical protein
MVPDLLNDVGKTGFIDFESFSTVGAFNFIHTLSPLLSFYHSKNIELAVKLVEAFTAWLTTIE